ncbi:MAG TPA: MarC family protein [Acidocella sp.]|nr:MarC family protein [Acidocella sp.]
MFEIFLTAVTTLFVAIGPVDLAPIFIALTAGQEARVRVRLALIATATAAAVLLAFAFGGNELLKLLGVGLPAFRTAGGILLLMVAADLLLAKHSGVSSITTSEEEEARHRPDIAVVPLAIPLIAGPGSMTAIVLLMGKARTLEDGAFVLAGLAVVLALTLITMLAAGRLVKVMGVTGANAIARISGTLLAALAMQFVFDGLSASGLFH